MRVVLKAVGLAGAVAANVFMIAAPAHAQVAAFLPDVESVAPGEATEIGRAHV